LKVTALLDVETLYTTDIPSTTSKKHDAKIGPQVARHTVGDLRSSLQIVATMRKPSATSSVKTAYVP
jgi:hypothetical protein